MFLQKTEHVKANARKMRYVIHPIELSLSACRLLCKVKLVKAQPLC